MEVNARSSNIYSSTTVPSNGTITRTRQEKAGACDRLTVVHKVRGWEKRGRLFKSQAHLCRIRRYLSRNPRRITGLQVYRVHNLSL